MLEIDVYNAGIRVTGYDSDNVELTIRDNRSGKDKRFGTPDFLYDIVENNNHITIVNRKSPRVKGIRLELKVPRNYSVKLSTYFGPKVEVSGIQGEIEVNGYFAIEVGPNAAEQLEKLATPPYQRLCKFSHLTRNMRIKPSLNCRSI